MKSALRLTFLILLVLIVALFSAPASLLAAVVAHYSKQRIILADANGFWWRGSAWLTVAGSGQSTLTLPARLQWRFEPLGPAFSITGSPMIAAPFSLAWNGKPVLTPGQAQLPASALQQLGMPFTLLRPTGQLNMRWQSVERMEIEWVEAASPLASIPRLGDYRLTLQSGRMQLTTLRGPLHLSGEAAAGSAFSGTARSDPEAADKLSSLLNILGPTQNGNTTLRF